MNNERHVKRPGEEENARSRVAGEEEGLIMLNVLKAIGNVPRHLFFDKVFHDNFAYKDVAFPIAAGQTISQPFTVATQSSLLKIEKRNESFRGWYRFRLSNCCID